MADNGNFFSISVTPDSRWAADEFSHLSSISITNFEVVQTTGPNEGPRSPGEPKASAGPDMTVPPNQPASLAGSVLYTNTALLRTTWLLGSAPASGAVQFGDASATNTTATFSRPGDYILVLRAEDGIHTPDYSPVMIRVAAISGAPVLTASLAGGSILLSWNSTADAPVTLESTGDVSVADPWDTLNFQVMPVQLPVTAKQEFFRLRLK